MTFILIALVALYIIYRVMSSRNDRHAQNMGVEEQVAEVRNVEPNVYADAARKIGSGALESARLATDNAKTVVSQVQRDAKIARLEALMSDEELMEALKTKLKSE